MSGVSNMAPLQTVQSVPNFQPAGAFVQGGGPGLHNVQSVQNFQAPAFQQNAPGAQSVPNFRALPGVQPAPGMSVNTLLRVPAPGPAVFSLPTSPTAQSHGAGEKKAQFLFNYTARGGLSNLPEHGSPENGAIHRSHSQALLASNPSQVFSHPDSSTQLLSNLPEVQTVRHTAPSFLNLHEYFQKRVPSSGSVQKLKLSLSSGLLTLLHLLSQLQRMTPLKAANSQTSMPRQALLSHLNLEFAPPVKKSRPNSPVPAAASLHTSPSHTTLQQPPPSREAASFIILPNETPLQTPSHSPPLLPRAPSDKGINSFHLISKLESQSQRQSDSQSDIQQPKFEQQDESIAVNGTVLPPIRSVFSFAQNPDSRGVLATVRRD